MPPLTNAMAIRKMFSVTNFRSMADTESAYYRIA
jgi:hypothetical protein